MKRFITLLLSFMLFICVSPSALAANSTAVQSADTLHALGLFEGIGIDTNGMPIYDLDRMPTRAEAVTMLVRLLGKDAEAKSKTWNHPFTDVPSWAAPYVGYAYVHQLTIGTGKTTFGSSDYVSASQYLTFVLRALGYKSSEDFQWDKAWKLSDRLGITNGDYNTTNTFLRGDVAIISNRALAAQQKGSSKTLAQELISNGVFTNTQYEASTLTQTPSKKISISEREGSYCVLEKNEHLLINAELNGSVLWTTSNSKVAVVNNGEVTAISTGKAVISAISDKGTATCVVLVATSDDTPQKAGTLWLKRGNSYYESSLAKYAKGNVAPHVPPCDVYTIDGEYYVNSVYLSNIMHCLYGTVSEIYSDNPYITTAQLSGNAKIYFTEEWHTDYLNATDYIETRTIICTLPNKVKIEYDFNSDLYINGNREKIYVFDVYYFDTEKSFFYLEAVGPFFDKLGVNLNWYYDFSTNRLIVELD